MAGDWQSMGHILIGTAVASALDWIWNKLNLKKSKSDAKDIAQKVIAETFERDLNALGAAGERIAERIRGWQDELPAEQVAKRLERMATVDSIPPPVVKQMARKRSKGK